MDGLPWHPKIVHLPLALAMLMPLVAGGLSIAWWRGVMPRRTWVIVWTLQAILVGGGVLAMRTGEADEERVERVVAERFIERHEQAAEAFVWAAAGVLLVMLVAALLPDERVARVVATASVAGTVLVLALAYRAGDAGGRLVYQHGAASAFATPSRAGAEADDD